MHRLQRRLARLIWAFAIIVSVLFYAFLGREGYNFYGDALGYYTYLPATFIYHNHKSIERLPQDRGIRPFIHGYMAQIGSGQRTPKGYVLNQYTYGVALMELPFFAIAHLFELARGSDANGFSASYRLAIDISSTVYGALGLLLVYRILRRYFLPHIASITTALLLIGTNLFWFCLRQQGMAHVPLFFLFALLMYLTIAVHERGQWFHFAVLGCTAGLITVIRPVDGICVFIPLLYNAGKPFFQTKIQFLLRHWWQTLLVGSCFLLSIIPQMLYWKWLTGYSIYDSYGPGQTFDFAHSHVWRGLFGASNGWFIYTPLMLATIVGLFLKKSHHNPFFAGTLVLLIGYVWAVYAWYLPNYPNGLGSRPMMDVYPLLAVPLAAAVERIGTASRMMKWPAFAAVAACVFINIQYSIKETTASIWSEDSKLSFNLRTLFRYTLRYDDLVLWDLGIPQPKAARIVGKPYALSFQDSALSQHIGLDTFAGKYYRMESGEEFSPAVLTVSYASLAGGGKASWIRASGRFYIPQPVLDIYKNQLLVIELHRGDSLLAWHGLRINNKVGLLEPQHAGESAQLFGFRDQQWGTVSCLIPLPDDVRPDDYLKMFVWNIGKTPLYLSSLRAEGVVAP